MLGDLGFGSRGGSQWDLDTREVGRSVYCSVKGILFGRHAIFFSLPVEQNPVNLKLIYTEQKSLIYYCCNFPLVR